MAETLGQLVAHLEQRLGRTKVVVWAHNSHLGDARATDRQHVGELNLGQLVRENFSRSTSVGFTTYAGTVTAASDWGSPQETKSVRPALADSWETVFHQTGLPQFFVIFSGNERLSSEFRDERLERAIGVVYRPVTERVSHYFRARIADQFDAVLHFDQTTALESLLHSEDDETSEISDTFPAAV